MPPRNPDFCAQKSSILDLFGLRRFLGGMASRATLVATLSLIVGLFGLVNTTFAFEVPQAPTGYVNDYANVLSTDTKTSLEQELKAFATTSSEVAVVTVPDMGGDYVEHYALSVAEKWGVGGKEKDNGVLLFLSIEERAVRIEVGYGLEGALPDSVANRIIQNEMIPLLLDSPAVPLEAIVDPADWVPLQLANEPVTATRA